MSASNEKRSRNALKLMREGYDDDTISRLTGYNTDTLRRMRVMEWKRAMNEEEPDF